MTELDDLIEE